MMNRGKYAKKRSGFSKSFRVAIPLLLIALVISLTAGGTLAYILDRTTEVENTFTPAQVSCSVDSASLKVTNTSNVKAYIRAMVAVNWMKTEGNKTTIYGMPPKATVTVGAGWEDVNGIYYYNSAVDPDTEIGVAPFTVSCTEVAPDGYELVIEVVAEAIQAEGMGDDVDSAQDAWAAAKTRPTGNG